VPAGGIITLPPQFVLGPFSVRSDGVLTLRDPGQAPGFQFWWRRCRVMVVLADDQLTLRAAIGRVPSTVEAAQVRPLVFSTLRGLPATLPQNWQIRLMPDHKVTLDAQEKLPAPSTAALLITELTRFLLALEPYLDLLLEAGVVLPMEAGIVNA
jgi:hypothetical protein